MRDFTKLVLLVRHKLHHPEKEFQTKQHDINFSLSGITYTEAVTLRLYHAYRLKKSFSFLRQVKCNNKADFFEANEKECCCIFISNYNFKHPDIALCIKRMETHNNLVPLMSLADEFTKLKLLQNTTFQKEFMILIFTTYRNLIVNNALKYHSPLKKSTLETIAFLYENLENLPLEQILDAIDMLAEELPPLLEKYEFNSDMKWKEWLKKYWWVPPIFLAVFGLRIAYKCATSKGTLRNYQPNENQ